MFWWWPVSVKFLLRGFCFEITFKEISVTQLFLSCMTNFLPVRLKLCKSHSVNCIIMIMIFFVMDCIYMFSVLLIFHNMYASLGLSHFVLVFIDYQLANYLARELLVKFTKDMYTQMIIVQNQELLRWKHWKVIQWQSFCLWSDLLTRIAC